jgi:hypothetical protein
VDLLELTQASLQGISAINFDVPPSSMARFGFDNAAKKASELFGQSSADEVTRLSIKIK